LESKTCTEHAEVSEIENPMVRIPPNVLVRAGKVIR
jgi:hypothetical protein